MWVRIFPYLLTDLTYISPLQKTLFFFNKCTVNFYRPTDIVTHGSVRIWVTTFANRPSCILSHAIMTLMSLEIRVIMACEKIQLGPFDYVATHIYVYYNV